VFCIFFNLIIPKCVSNISIKLNYDAVWVYCCSMGMKPIEFSDENFAEALSKLMLGLYSTMHFLMLFVLYEAICYFDQGNGALVDTEVRYVYMGETEAFNGTHERWCLSKQLISIPRKSSNLNNLR
jgi:hypothetical protein